MVIVSHAHAELSFFMNHYDSSSLYTPDCSAERLHQGIYLVKSNNIHI